MSLRSLSTEKMVQISSAWVDPKRHRKTLSALPLVAGLIVPIDAAHEGLLTIQTTHATASVDAELALMDWALAHAHEVQPREQHGTPSYYRKRSPADSRIDPERPLAELFDLLRVADPERYPAHFEYRGRRYRLRLEPMGEPMES